VVAQFLNFPSFFIPQILLPSSFLSSTDILSNSNPNPLPGNCYQSWLSRLCLSNTLSSVRLLAHELVLSIHPTAFKSEWFLSQLEINAAKHKGISSTSLASHKRRESKNKSQDSISTKCPMLFKFWVGQSSWDGSIRVHR
jgi:hypothetical protein